MLRVQLATHLEDLLQHKYAFRTKKLPHANYMHPCLWNGWSLGLQIDALMLRCL
jgi:hypothetical protein